MSYTISMERAHQPRSGLALGGIGSGWFELRQDGRFYNWNIVNNEPSGTGARLAPGLAENALWFAVRFHEQGSQPRIKLLQLPLRHDAASLIVQVATYPWLTGVARIAYEASFPFSRLKFSDPEMPLVVELEAFSPFIPHDVKNSSLPAAIFNFRVRATGNKPVVVTLLGVFSNLTGHDVARKRFTGRHDQGNGWAWLEVGTELVDPAHDSWGTQALFSSAADSTYWLGWDHRHSFGEKLIEEAKLPNFDGVAGRNWGKDEQTGEPLARGTMKNTLAVTRRLKPRSAFDHTFLLTWHAPNRYAAPGQTTGAERRFEGYAYANHFDSATTVGQYVSGHLADLTARTRQFHASFFDSTAPRVVLDQVNAQLNTFFTSAWLTKAGDFGIQEGMTDDMSWGPLATVDVSLYGSVPVGALFPELEKSTWRAHARLQQAGGEVCHGIGRNFSAADVHEAVTHRLDLPSQFAVLALRSFFWTGDRGYLGEVWPHVKNALDYVLKDRDPNADLLPDMAGAMCSYDNFPMFGAASYVASLWLAALAHAVAAAKVLGDEAAATRYEEVLGKAQAVFEQKLWNGKYYRLYNDVGGAKGGVDEGCLTDQLCGEWTLRLAGLSGVIPPERVRRAMREIVRRNTRYWGLRNCTWPGDKFVQPVAPENWGDQANICWSGTELCFASFLLYEGFIAEATAIVAAVDQRYRDAGLYFDHQEFGGHYYRPMGAWAILHALLGLTVNDGCYAFAPRLPDKNQKLFFAVPDATAQYVRRITGRKETVMVRVLTGSFTCRQLTFALASGKRSKVSVNVDGTVTRNDDRVVIAFPRLLTLRAGETIEVRAD